MTVDVETVPSVLLWPNGAPGALGNDDGDQPSFTVHLPEPEKATGSAVVIFPGGAYCNLSVDHEGRQVADWLNARGVAAFVLQYRLGPRYHHPIELGDAQRAIRTVRANAAQWGIDPQRIGVCGFSAGGHLASTAGTHYDAGNSAADDPTEQVSCRPDFMILCYPVITMTDAYTHEDTRKFLLGENPPAELIEYLSNEKQITTDTPPTFFFHTGDDPAVPVENSVMFYLALRKAGVRAEMHIYEHGPHGIGLCLNDPVLGNWSDDLAVWLRGLGIL